MFLIFGWGWRGRQLDTVPLTCQRCGNHSGHPVVRERLMVSLFFVPLIPLRTRHRMYCPICNASREVDPRGARVR